MVIAVKEYYQNRRICDSCFSLLLYNNEDMLKEEEEENWDYITCPICGERNYV